MAKQTLVLTRLESVANVDSKCFYAFKSREGNLYFTFRPDAGSEAPVQGEPPVPFGEFRTFACTVHHLVIPPFLQRIPSLLYAEPGSTKVFNEEVVVSDGKSQLLSIITDFQDPPASGQATPDVNLKEAARDFSFPHFHKVAGGAPKAGQVVAQIVAHRPEQSCPTAIHPFGQRDEVITFSFAFDHFKASSDEVGNGWMAYIRPEVPMHFILLQLSGGQLVYGYYPMNTYVNPRTPQLTLGGLDNFRKDFRDPNGVVYGMPFARSVDLLDIWLIPVVLEEPVTREDPTRE